MSARLTQIRLKSVWLIVPLYLYFADPTAGGRVSPPWLLVAIGAAVAIAGGALRAWAAGTIKKNKVLSTHGAYAFTRNPLYLGSFLIGIGFAVASGRFSFLLFFLASFAVVYSRTMSREERRLEGLFGADYRRYADAVPRFIPRLPSLEDIRGVTPADSPDVMESDAEGGVAIAAPPVARVALHPPFELRRYLANREYQTLLGLALMFLALAVKLAL